MSDLAERTNQLAASEVDVWAELRQALRPHRRGLLIAGAFAALSAVTEVFIISLVAAFTERLLSDTASVPVLSELNDGVLSGLTALAIVFKIGLDLTQARVNARALRRFEAKIRRDVAVLQARAKWSVIEDSEPGALHALMWNSAAQARSSFAQVLSLIAGTTSLLLMLGATVVSAGKLAIAGVLGVVVFGAAFRPLSRAAKQAGVRMKVALRSYGAQLNEDIRMSREIRVLGAHEVLADRLADQGDELAEAVARQSYLSAILTSGYANAVYALALLGFIAIDATGSANPAPLAAVVLLLYRSLTYGRGVQSSLQGLASSAPFVADVNHWIDQLADNAESQVGAKLTETFDEIRFADVGLTYANGTVGLKDLNLVLRSGEAVAAVGPSGSGKSSFVSLLLALRDATEGAVTINGIPMHDVDMTSWRRRVSMVPQESLLFDTTIEENVRCWREGISRERIIEALRQAHVLDDVLAMPGGLESPVGEGGRRLSGGQRQRICLARALVSDPEVLVLDEPTSALDGASERGVKESLEELKGRVTLVIVAHRMTTITVCDRVLVFGNGRVEHDTDPASAIQESSFFARAIELSENR